MHTLAKLRAIVHEIFVECATLYCQKANQMRLAKIKKTWNDAKLKDVKAQHEKDMEQTEAIIFRENGITEEFFGRWLEANSDDKEIRDTFAKLDQLKETVFEKQSIEAIKSVNLPAGLTEDMYIFIYRKQHAQIRHHSYKVLAEAGSNTS